MKIPLIDFHPGTKFFGGQNFLGTKMFWSPNEIGNHFSCSPQEVLKVKNVKKRSAAQIYNSYAGLVNFDDHHVSTMLEKLYHFLENELIF